MQMSKYIMALDAGTTSNRCILFDRAGRVKSVAQQEFTQHYPQPGWVEHDAGEIWDSQIFVAREAMRKAGAAAEEVGAIGITNQRETTVVWDKKTGVPICPAIVWQCRRTAQMADDLRKLGLAEEIHQKTGLIIDAYFSATKLKWILDRYPGSRERARRGDLLFGTIDTWLIWKLTGGRVHVTDYTNASRTMLFNIHSLTWDEDILKLLDIPREMLPEVKPSSTIFGAADPVHFGRPIPIAGAAGDQQAALFGQACFHEGDTKNTYGTGCFLLMNTGTTPVLSQNGLLTTIACSSESRVLYALEGSVYVAGAAIQWLRDEMKLIESAQDSERIAASVNDTQGCYVVPAFTGLGTPYWDQYARGTIVGLTRGCGRNEIVRATLESIAYQACDVIDAMEQDFGHRLTELKVDGGASQNNFLMQFQSDLLGAPVIRPVSVESTAFGAASLAALAVGWYDGTDEIKKRWRRDRSFAPAMAASEREEKRRGWKRAVDRARSWIEQA
jgi:glycerol kinase